MDAPWTSLACRPGSLSTSGSQSPSPAPPLAGVETESQGGAATHKGVTTTPVPGSGLALSVHAAPVGSILCSGALNSSLPRGGRPGPERPRPWPHSSQKAEPRPPRPPEHSPSCCLDRPAPQHPARALPRVFALVGSQHPSLGDSRHPPGAHRACDNHSIYRIEPRFDSRMMGSVL